MVLVLVDILLVVYVASRYVSVYSWNLLLPTSEISLLVGLRSLNLLSEGSRENKQLRRFFLLYYISYQI